jgi:hypothetical protein
MDKAFIARIAALVVIIINAVLTLMGVPFVIPAEFADWVASITIVGFSVYAAVKNDFFKKNKKEAK